MALFHCPERNWTMCDWAIDDSANILPFYKGAILSTWNLRVGSSDLSNWEGRYGNHLHFQCGFQIRFAASSRIPKGQIRM